MCKKWLLHYQILLYFSNCCAAIFNFYVSNDLFFLRFCNVPSKEIPPLSKFFNIYTYIFFLIIYIYIWNTTSLVYPLISFLEIGKIDYKWYSDWCTSNFNHFYYLCPRNLIHSVFLLLLLIVLIDERYSLNPS